MTGHRPRVQAPAADQAIYGSTTPHADVHTETHSDVSKEPTRERHTRIIATISHAPDTYELLFRYQQNTGAEMSEHIALALRQYFADKPEARAAMPEWAEVKLQEKLFKVKK
jgi:hypothetical protein